MAASPIPAALKSADISRFALRASQLETAKPIISYWCNYWIVNQIISKNLQNADEESKQYTIHIMDKLEQFKGDNPDNDAVTDDLAGKAYIEQFGLDTFQRADNAVRANKASRQTADTFQASATFLELLQIFGPLEAEIAAKIKFAKYHALRIAKAIKAGEDPNLSNPKPQPTPEEQAPPIEKSDFEFLDGPSGASKPRQPSIEEVPDEGDRTQRNLARQSSLDESLHPSRTSSVPRPPVPKVEDVADEADPVSRTMAQKSATDESLHPSRAPSIPRAVHVDSSSGPGAGLSPRPQSNGLEGFYTSAHPESSPGIPPVESPTQRKSSVGGNYFPAVPSPAREDATATPPELPSAPQDLTPYPPPPGSDASLPPSAPSYPPGDPPHFLPPDSIPPSLLPHTLPAPTPQLPPQLRQQSGFQAPQSFYNSQSPMPQPPVKEPQHQEPPPALDLPAAVDEEAIMKAQKHARWAISALNFEDVPTAIKELRGALETLGAK